ncbi:MAG: sigma-70 family RNA polymerase sigma factor [Pirellulales bacterium]
MSDSDEELVSQARRGDHEAFGQLYDRYAGLIRSVCFEATGNVVDSQDLAQEVFLSAFRQLDQLKDPRRFAGWLVGIGRLSGLEWRRSRTRDRLELVGEATVEIAGQECLSRDDRWADVVEAFECLSEDERLGVHLFYLEEQPAEVARRLLNLSLSGFYRLLDRARAKLAQKLKLKELNP